MGLQISRKHGDGEDIILEIAEAATPPKAAGTASTGTSTKYAREDHVHPAQTTVSGNAGSATKLATARTIVLSGDVTGSTSFDGSANKTITATLADSGVTEGAYGPAAAATLAFGGSVNVPQLTVDAKGRVTAAASRAIKLPAAPTTVSGNAGTATKLATARTLTLSGDVTGSTIFDGSANKTIATKFKNPSVQHSPADTRAALIVAGTDYAVPAYIVGSGRLQVFIDGVLCAGGSDTDACVYSEVGAKGDASTAIQFHQAIATDYEIIVRVQ